MRQLAREEINGSIKENWKTIKEAVRREYSLSDISYHTWVEPWSFTMW